MGETMKTLATIAGLALFASTSAHAVDIGVGVKAGTVGVGAEFSVALTQTINARISLTSLNINDLNETLTVGDSQNKGDIDATMKLDFGANALLFDWYVFDGTFHLTGGFMKNNGKVSFSGVLQDSITVNGQTYDASDIDGAITGTVSAGETYKPYLGIGWGRKAGNKPGLSLTAEIGVALLDPKANLNATVNMSGNNNLSQQALDSRIKATEDDINSELSVLKAWPVLSLGLNYAF
jgi:hypothetical protein